MAALRPVLMSAETKMRQHQWVEMVVTPVDVLPDMDEGHPVTVPSGATPKVTVGCFSCNMGLSEGFGIPCPGQDLFEEDDEGNKDQSAP